jgi:membrane protein implicated in regulation of membrane protease activity
METIFLACFVFGALFTLVGLALGLGGHGAAHLSHGHHGLHLAGEGHQHGLHPWSAGLPLLNASSIIGCLTWFGAAGYLLLRLGSLALPAVLLGALVAGAVGWYLVARFLGLILSGERELDPDDYRLEGTVGTLTVSIPAGGTGEVLFSKAGARPSEAARALDGRPIPRGTEVVITSYVDGFATVQPWGEFLAAHDAAAATQNSEA